MTNNNKEDKLTEKITDDNTCFKYHEDQAIGRQAELMVMSINILL